MWPETPAYLWDAREAARRAASLVVGISVEEYHADWVRQAAAERQLEIMGEALSRVRRRDPEVAGGIPSLNEVIGTRNVIAHGYDVVDHARVWVMLNEDAPALAASLTRLLESFPPPVP